MQTYSSNEDSRIDPITVSHPSGAAKRRLLPGLHGLRCFAALAVVIFHLKGIALVPPPASIMWLTDTFGSSVRLFFLLSAFSLMYSTLPSTGAPDWIRGYAVKRFFRIAPAFYLMIVLTLLWNHYLRGTKTEIGEIILNLSFLFGLVSDRQTSIVLGGWTIGSEVIFYALFPLIIGVVRGLKSALVFLVLAIIVGVATASLSLAEGQPWWLYAMSFPLQLEYFSAGVVVFFIFQRTDAATFNKHFWTLLTSCLVMYAVVVWCDGLIDRIVQMALFGLLCLWQAHRPSRLLSSRFAVFWGERSYGIYLIHSPLLVILRPQFAAITSAFGPTIGYFVSLVVALIATLILAHVIYVLVERPGILLGRQILARLPGQIVTAKPA